MPSGKVHTRINLTALPIFVFLLLFYGITKFNFVFLFSIGFIIGTYILSPDLDTYSTPYRLWGPLRFLWHPYQAVMPHRSILTHSYVLGDVIRVLYLVLITSPFLYIINAKLLDGRIFAIVEVYRIELLSIFTGIVIASALHITADLLNTKRKRVLRKYKRKK